MSRRLFSIPGNKAGFCMEQANYLPVQKFSKAWETNAGTAAFSNNILSAMNLESIIATELNKATYSLIQQVKQNPYALVNRLRDFEYCSESFEWAENCSGRDYENMTQLDIAAARYIIAQMSYNGIGNGYRDIDKGADDDFQCWISAQQHRNRYHRQLRNIINYSEGLQNVEIVHADMLTMFDEKASDPDLFIYCDIPYTNKLRSRRLYQVDTDIEWHERFADKLASMSKQGMLRAQMMLCNYVDSNIEQDIYAMKLLESGWALYLMKDVARPTIIKENSKSRKKGRALEAIYLNYTPINPVVGRDRIITYKDVREDSIWKK